MTHRRSRRFASLVVPLIAVLSACQPAATVPDVAAPAIDSARLLSHVETLASDAYMGRRAGTDGGRMAIRYVEGQMMEMGLRPACGDDLRQPFSFESRDGVVDATNLIAIIPGSGSSEGAVVLSAHFDHLGQRDTDIFNGADDNASGTSALLEIARVLKEAPLVHDVVLAAVDAEEMGLRGARHFVSSECFETLDVRLNVNLDMISRSQPGVLYAAGTYHYPFLRPILELIDTPDGFSLAFGHDEPGSGSDDWTNASDHAPFHAQGVPFIYFGVEDHAGYHQPTDDAADITPAFFLSSATFILEALRGLDAQIDDCPKR